MSLSFDLFWSFRSPYCYLAAPRLLALTRTHDVVCRLRPVYPLAVRVKDFFKTVNPLWPGYLMHDLPRMAEMQGLPMVWPDPDPIAQDMATLEVAADQPHVARLTRLGAAAEEAGAGLDYAREVSGAIFGGVKNWHEGDVLADAARRAGLDPDALERAVAEEADRLDAVIAANETAHEQAGHWGVPLMVFDGEPFFGHDRVDALIWRMDQKGLRAR